MLERGPILRFLSTDHQRLSELFVASFPDGKPPRCDRFDEFREGLLRHIGIEEKILFPALRQLKDPSVENVLKKLHADHAAISAILILSPTSSNAKRIEQLLIPHNEIEEGKSGIYELCDRLPKSTRERILTQAKSYPAVKIKPYNDAEVAVQNAEKMFQEALKVPIGSCAKCVEASHKGTPR